MSNGLSSVATPLSFVSRGTVEAGSEGTLLWVGDRKSEAFRDAFEFCEAVSSQLAFRADIQEALYRPAACVRAIIWCRTNDSGRDQSSFSRLQAAYNDAVSLLLLGPLCAGQRPSPAARLEVQSCAWSEWESPLPSLLSRCGLRSPESATRRDVLIASRSRDNARALAELASTAGCHAVCCRPDAMRCSTRVDEVWWDDSATGRAPDWRGLIEDNPHPHARHAWITSFLTPVQRRRAIERGVSIVLPKPGDLSPLTRSIPAFVPQAVLDAA
ncbi:MAG: hypothetical protein AAFU85_04690 [Planctomycetota bacterium]